MPPTPGAIGPIGCPRYRRPTRNPSAPTSLAAAFGNQNVTLTWAAPASDGGSAITRYEYRNAPSSGTLPDSWIGVGLALTANIAGLTNGTEYDFEVRAVNDQGDGDGSNRFRHARYRAPWRQP